MNDYDCIVIGGGASGLMLAAGLECRGLIIEKTAKPGSKLLMSGGGHCNITHGGSIKDFINAYGGEAGQKLRKCLYRHSNMELAGWLEDAGVALLDENGDAVFSYDLGMAERIFPASMRSSDVLNAFLHAARRGGWEMITESGVRELQPLRQISSDADDAIEDTSAKSFDDDGGCADDGDSSHESAYVWKVITDDGSAYFSRNLVIASGGITYPETGSDGSMFEVLSKLGIEISEPRPALAPVYVRDYPYEELSGISLPDVTVTAFGSDAACTCKGKAARMTGDLLFTHKGFSGPVILNISRYAEPGQLLRIKYNKELSELPRRMQRILEDRSRGPSGDIRTTKLAALLDADDFTVRSVDRRGMVTAGGISLKCVDMASMQIRIGEHESGLYAIGEAIDADGITGGYNLQMCWSTAMTAADSIRARLDR
ncbi:MAG: NAD(P)/FAD-dependent oxidoreductase [Mogibacterium sp.]|nr:NAD(P)/FAD-dependent oxidoreductase [Mogibacterium sp.]